MNFVDRLILTEIHLLKKGFSCLWLLSIQIFLLTFSHNIITSVVEHIFDPLVNPYSIEKSKQMAISMMSEEVGSMCSLHKSRDIYFVILGIH